VKFCYLIANLSVILPEVNLSKLKLEYLKSGFKSKKETYKQRQKNFCFAQFDFFRVQLKFALRIQP